VSSILSRESLKRMREAAYGEAEAAAEQALAEPQPTVEDLRKHTFAASPVDQIYPHDYTGLPE
jgi:2-oxoisovalerate dehydrogenase E1 component alpha subunit